MQQVTSENWDEFVTRDKAIVEFSAAWCGPCRTQKQILGAIENEHGNIVVGEVDVENDFELADKLKVMSVPTLLVMAGGQESKRLVGLQQKSTIDALLS